MVADSGYADQSHLCRETLPVTGFTPEALRQRMAEDEGFWSYRLWGGYSFVTAGCNIRSVSER